MYMTAPMALPMPPAAMRTATPPQHWQQRVGTCSIPCKTTMAYHALQAVEGLIITGATGTNVNDVAVVLIGGEEQADA